MSSAATYVLDSWPIMEWLQRREPSTAEVERLLDLAINGDVRLLMSRINYGEVLYSCWRKFPQDQAAHLLADIDTFPIEYVEVDAQLVDEAAHIKVDVSASYADCFAAALALRVNAPVVTGDDELRKVSLKTGLLLHWLGA